MKHFFKLLNKRKPRDDRVACSTYRDITMIIFDKIYRKGTTSARKGVRKAGRSQFLSFQATLTRILCHGNPWEQL